MPLEVDRTLAVACNQAGLLPRPLQALLQVNAVSHAAQFTITHNIQINTVTARMVGSGEGVQRRAQPIVKIFHCFQRRDQPIDRQVTPSFLQRVEQTRVGKYA